jgi:hypothetical protein
MAHARRKLFEAYKLNGSQIAGHTVTLIAKLYEVERTIKALDAQGRQEARQAYARPMADELHRWLTSQRQHLAKADATAKAIDYSLGRWRALALGRRNWLFVGSQGAGERAANVMSLLESAKLNGHDPWGYLRDVLERLPTLKQRDIDQLLPHHWRPAGVACVGAAAEKTDSTAQTVSSL